VVNFNEEVPVGQFVTATATRISVPNDTSEFSRCLAVTAYEPMVVDTTSDANLTAARRWWITTAVCASDEQCERCLYRG